MHARRHFAAAVLAAPAAVFAQFTATAFHTFDVRGPNSLNFSVNARVIVGAFGPAGLVGVATRATAGACGAAPANLTLPNNASINIPTLAQGTYFVSDFAGICPESWNLVLTAGAETAIAVSPTLTGTRVIPFVGNAAITSSSDGKLHSFSWAGVPGVDSVRINIWDRGPMATGGLPQLLTSQNYPGSATTFGINLALPGPYLNDHPYTMEVQAADTRDNNIAASNNINIISRSRTYFDFVMPSAPTKTGPVFLPIVEYLAGSPKYTFTITVDGTGTFVIDPDIAIGYIYETAPGNPNFRSVSLPAVGDGRYLVEIFDADTGQYGRSFIARAGQTYSAPAHGYPNGVSKFRVKGIEASAALDAGNATAFPTALQFMGPGTFTGSMVPITKYTFSGFLPPINLPPTVNTGRAGSSFPFKWTLADLQGAAVTDLGSVSSITYKPSACAPFTADPTGGLPAKAGEESRLRFEPRAKQYVFDWKTPKTPGCYVLFLTLDTGQVFSANVMLSKGRERDD